jgi:parallel beta-helix repeat protein
VGRLNDAQSGGGSPDGHVAGNSTTGGLMGISIDSSDRTLVENNRVSAVAGDSEPYYNGLELIYSSYAGDAQQLL